MSGYTSYLAHRTQTTHTDNDHISSKKKSVWSYSRSFTFPDLYIYLYSNKLGLNRFADDTNLLYADNDLKTLETVVNNELNNVCH